MELLVTLVFFLCACCATKSVDLRNLAISKRLEGRKKVQRRFVEIRMNRLGWEQSAVKKVKSRLGRKKNFSVRKVASGIGVSKSSAHRVLKEGIQLFVYKKTIKPLLSDDHKATRIKFVDSTQFLERGQYADSFFDEKNVRYRRRLQCSKWPSADNQSCWSWWKWWREAEAKISSTGDGLARHVFQRGYSVGHSCQGHSRSCVMHPRSASSDSNLWKQGLWKQLDFPTGWCGSTRPPIVTAAVLREISPDSSTRTMDQPTVRVWIGWTIVYGRNWFAQCTGILK